MSVFHRRNKIVSVFTWDKNLTKQKPNKNCSVSLGELNKQHVLFSPELITNILKMKCIICKKRQFPTVVQLTAHIEEKHVCMRKRCKAHIHAQNESCKTFFNNVTCELCQEEFRTRMDWFIHFKRQRKLLKLMLEFFTVSDTPKDKAVKTEAKDEKRNDGECLHNNKFVVEKINEEDFIFKIHEGCCVGLSPNRSLILYMQLHNLGNAYADTAITHCSLHFIHYKNSVVLMRRVLDSDRVQSIRIDLNQEYICRHYA